MTRVRERTHEMDLTDRRDDLRRDWHVLVLAAYTLRMWSRVSLADVNKTASVPFEMNQSDAREVAGGEGG